MSFIRKLERELAKQDWKIKNEGVSKKFRETFESFWEKYQDKKYGKKEHYIICKMCKKNKR